MDLSVLVEGGLGLAFVLLLAAARWRGGIRAEPCADVVRVHANAWFLSFLGAGLLAAVIMAPILGHGFAVVSRRPAGGGADAIVALAMSIVGLGVAIYCVRQIRSALRLDVTVDVSGIVSNATGLHRRWDSLRNLSIPNLTALRLTFDDGGFFELRDHMSGWAAAVALVARCVDATKFDATSRENFARILARSTLS